MLEASRISYSLTSVRKYACGYMWIYVCTHSRGIPSACIFQPHWLYYSAGSQVLPSLFSVLPLLWTESDLIYGVQDKEVMIGEGKAGVLEP